MNLALFVRVSCLSACNSIKVDEAAILEMQQLRVAYVFCLLRDITLESDHSVSWQWSDLPLIFPAILAAKEADHVTVDRRTVFWAAFWAQLQTCEDNDDLMPLLDSAHHTANGNVAASLSLTQAVLDKHADDDAASKSSGDENAQQTESVAPLKMSFNQTDLAIRAFSQLAAKDPSEMNDYSMIYAATSLRCFLQCAMIDRSDLQILDDDEFYFRPSMDDDAGGMFVIKKVRKEMLLPFYGTVEYSHKLKVSHAKHVVACGHGFELAVTPSDAFPCIAWSAQITEAPGEASFQVDKEAVNLTIGPTFAGSSDELRNVKVELPVLRPKPNMVGKTDVPLCRCLYEGDTSSTKQAQLASKSWKRHWQEIQSETLQRSKKAKKGAASFAAVAAEDANKKESGKVAGGGEKNQRELKHIFS